MSFETQLLAFLHFRSGLHMVHSLSVSMPEGLMLRSTGYLVTGCPESCIIRVDHGKPYFVFFFFFVFFFLFAPLLLCFSVVHVYFIFIVSSAGPCQNRNCPPSVRPSYVRRTSVCGIDYPWIYCIDFFQILVVACPGQYARTFLGGYFLRIFFSLLTCDPLGAKFQNDYFAYRLLRLNLSGKVLNFPEFSSQWSSQNGFEDIWNFKLPIFNAFLRKFQTYHFKFTFQTCLWRNKKKSIIWKTSDGTRAKRSEIWDPWVVVQYI